MDNRLVEDVEVLFGYGNYEKSIKSTNHCKFPTARFALHVSAKCRKIINNNDNIALVIVMRYEYYDRRPTAQGNTQTVPVVYKCKLLRHRVLMILPKLKITVYTKFSDVN